MLTTDAFIAAIGEDEALSIAGLGPRDERILDDARIAEAVGFAVELVRAHVRGRHPQVDAVAASELLAGAAVDIARYRIRDRGGQQSAMTELVRQRYEDALRLLREIAAGRVDPVLSSSNAAPDAGLAVSAAMPDARIGRALEGWR